MNRSTNTIRGYVEAVEKLDAFLAANGMSRAVANIRREHIEAFIEDQLARLRPASAANRYRCASTCAGSAQADPISTAR